MTLSVVRGCSSSRPRDGACREVGLEPPSLLPVPSADN